jgi:hypothetical protein
LSGVLLFWIHWRPGGYVVLAAGQLVATMVDRRLAKDLLLMAFGLVAISLVPINTDISWDHMLFMGAALTVAVVVPYLVSRFGYRDHAVRFPIRAGHKWTTLEKWYLVAVVVLGWAILPVYMIGSGVYLNWPAAADLSTLSRLFVGTNALGIWDELFFICTCFALLRRHFVAGRRTSSRPCCSRRSSGNSASTPGARCSSIPLRWFRVGSSSSPAHSPTSYACICSLTSCSFSCSSMHTTAAGWLSSSTDRSGGSITGRLSRAASGSVYGNRTTLAGSRREACCQRLSGVMRWSGGWVRGSGQAKATLARQHLAPQRAERT